jgi:lipopolysaccharide/colanic/teichoic acid biosynthesis glycosyltransferase
MDRQENAPQKDIWRQTTGIPRWKRVLDVTVILLVCPGVLILGGAVALLVKLGSSGPILFRQKRVGYRGKQFICLKFRTMLTDSEIESHRLHTQNLIRSKAPMTKLDARKDPRLVPLGSLLRATGLDELPQLINVLRGEMSLVGPRPCIPYEYELYEAWHRQRFNAAPGLTGLWQVSGKNHTTFEQMVRLDIQYSEQLSFRQDAKIIVKTLPAIWGQYCEMRDAKREEGVVAERDLGKSVQSYQ